MRVKRLVLMLIALAMSLGLGWSATSGASPAPSATGPSANCYLTAHNPDANIWVHVSGSGNASIRGHGHLHCQTTPNEINAKGHFQKFVFPPPNEPDHNGHWIEVVATQVYHGLNEHGSIIVPDHHIKWRSGRWRFAFEYWGRSSGTEPNGNHYGKGYYCSDNLNIPRSPHAHTITIHPDTHRCYPPPGHIGGHVVTTAAHRAPVINHQFCFAARPSLCMATKHTGVNSSIVLRTNGHTRAQAIVWNNGRLLIKGHPGQCVGTESHSVEARSAHCNGGHGIRWRLIVFPGRGIGFDNVAADRAASGNAQHFLLATAQTRGNILAIGTNLHLPHVWRDCAGHCG